jgi:hypothetical protein
MVVIDISEEMRPGEIGLLVVTLNRRISHGTETNYIKDCT